MLQIVRSFESIHNYQVHSNDYTTLFVLLLFLFPSHICK